LTAQRPARGGADQRSPLEVYTLLEQMAHLNSHSIVVVTGGEPLTRPDIRQIARKAVSLGFMVVFGTNGMLIDDRLARELVDIGVMGMSISIDSIDPAKHNAFRGLPGPWERAMAGIAACTRKG